MQPNVRGDASQLDQLLDDDFVEIGASGRTWTKASVIADLVTSPNLDVQIVGLSARQINPQIVLVTYTTISPERRVLRSSWWRDTGSAWKCLFHQGTTADVPDGVEP